MTTPKTGSAQERAGPKPTEQQALAGPGQRSDPRLPWNGKPRTADILCWSGITLSGVFYWVLLPFRASLVGTHPVVSVLLNGSTESVISAAAFARVGHGTLAAVLLAAIPGLMKFVWLFWWAGRLWGEKMILMLPAGRSKRGRRLVAQMRRSGRKFTWPAVVISYFLPIPSAIIYIVAGWTGMSLVTFLLLDLIGALLWAGLLAGLGYSLGHQAVVVAKTISHYGLWIAIATAVLIVFFQVRAQRRMTRELSVASAA